MCVHCAGDADDCDDVVGAVQRLLHVNHRLAALRRQADCSTRALLRPVHGERAIQLHPAGARCRRHISLADNNNNNRIYIAPYGRNFREASSDLCFLSVYISTEFREVWSSDGGELENKKKEIRNTGKII